MKQNLVEQGAIQMLVDALRPFSLRSIVESDAPKSHRNSGHDTGSPGVNPQVAGLQDAVDVDIQCDMLHILAALCKDHLPRWPEEDFYMLPLIFISLRSLVRPPQVNFN